MAVSATISDANKNWKWVCLSSAFSYRHSGKLFCHLRGCEFHIASSQFLNLFTKAVSLPRSSEYCISLVLTINRWSGKPASQCSTLDCKGGGVSHVIKCSFVQLKKRATQKTRSDRKGSQPPVPPHKSDFYVQETFLYGGSVQATCELPPAVPSDTVQSLSPNFAGASCVKTSLPLAFRAITCSEALSHEWL